MLVSVEGEDPRLISREIIFQEFQPMSLCDHDTSTSQTDGQTTCHDVTAVKTIKRYTRTDKLYVKHVFSKKVGRYLLYAQMVTSFDSFPRSDFHCCIHTQTEQTFVRPILNFADSHISC